MIFQNSNNNNNLEALDVTDPTASFRSFSSDPTVVAALTPLHHNNDEETHLEIHINSQDTLTATYNQLKNTLKSNNKKSSPSNSSSRTIIKSITMSFRLQDPYKRISQLKKLTKLFAMIGSLPQLEQLVFVDADLMMTNLYQLFKNTGKSSSLKVLKFHNCTFVRVKILKLANQILWRGIQKHTTNLHTLELLKCSYAASDSLCRETKAFVCDVPVTTFQQCRSLQRLALDECGMDNNMMASLLTKLPALQELELRPNFDRAIAKYRRRQQYQAKKDAIHTLLTRTIPRYLASNTTLTKLAINLDQHHMDKVYQPAMESWIDLLLEHNNCTLTDMTITPQRLLDLQQQEEKEQATLEAEDDDDDEEEVEEVFDVDDMYDCCLLEDLKNMLRLNQLFGNGSGHALPKDDTMLFFHHQQPPQLLNNEEKDSDANISVVTTTSDSSMESDYSLGVGASSELLPDLPATSSTSDDLLLPVDPGMVVGEFDV